MLSCISFDNSTNNAADTTAWLYYGSSPAHVNSSMVTSTRNGTVVTSVLTIANVSFDDVGTGYFCSPLFGIRSEVGVILSVAGNYEYLQISVFCMISAELYMYNIIMNHYRGS